MTRIETKLSAVRPQKQHHSPKPPGRINPAQSEHRKLFSTDILVKISLCMQVNVRLPITKCAGILQAAGERSLGVGRQLRFSR